MLSFILLFDIYAGWIMKNYLHATLYFFNYDLIEDLIKGDSDLKKKLDNYFLSNYTQNLNKIKIQDVIAIMLDELYSDNQENFINQIGCDLLSLCNVPPVTIFLTKFSKNTVILDKFYNVLRMKNIFHINHGMFSFEMLPLLKDCYLDELNLYKNKKYIPILQHLLNHPVMDINIDQINGDGNKVFGNVYYYDVYSMKQVLNEVETTRTDIEHYLDKLGLYESFKQEYQFITRNDLYKEITYIMKIIFPDKFLCDYKPQIIDYIMGDFHQDRFKSKYYKNNILHINGHNKQIIDEAKDFLKKYYKRTIFEKKYNNNKDHQTIQETKDMIKLLQNHQSDLISSELIGYVRDNNSDGNVVDFNYFFVKSSMKTLIDPNIFIYNANDNNNDFINTEAESNKSETLISDIATSCNLILKTNNKDDVKSINDIEPYLESIMNDVNNKAHSFIVSEFVNFKYEQRCFFKNGRIVGTTPCARKISFLHCYPNGRIHPYFIDNHNDDIDNLKLDRKMAAEMAWFVKAAARDYNKLQFADGNTSSNRCGTIDVGYDVDKQEWKIIEIHYFDGDIFQSDAGLYGMNPFLFNPNTNIKEIYSLNNDMLRINWRRKNDKNALLIDLLEIKDDYKIQSNNLLLMLPSKSLRFINTYQKSERNNFQLLAIVGNEFKSTLIDYIEKHQLYQSKKNILEKLNFYKMIDVKISNEQITVILPFGTITIRELEFESTHLLVQSDLDKKITKAFEIVPHQTHHQIIMNYLCELIITQCSNVYN